MEWTKSLNLNPNPHGNRAQISASTSKVGGNQTQNEVIFPEPEQQTKAKSVEEEALLNSLILSKVLGSLDDPLDLLSCRQVCSDWKSLTTEILLKRRSLITHLRYDEKDGVYVSSRENSSRDKDCKMLLENLVRLIKSAEVGQVKFPCLCFGLSAGDLETEDLSSFLNFYGEKVEELELSLQPYYKKRGGGSSDHQNQYQQLSSSVRSVRNLVGRQLPNLKVLDMVKMEKYEGRSSREAFTFHHLFQEFELESNGTLAETETEEPKKLFMIAQLPKLEKLCINFSQYHQFHRYNSWGSVIQKKVRKNMESPSVEFRRLSDLNWSCGECVGVCMSLKVGGKFRNLEIKKLGLDLMEKIIEKYSSQLHFDLLDINFKAETVRQLMGDPWMKKRMIRVLNTIFEIAQKNPDTKNNNKIPVHIKIKGPIGFLSDLDSDSDFEIPVMENVSNLTLEKPQENQREWEIPLEQNGQMGILSDLPFPFFPCGFDLSTSFPNLHTLELKNWHGDISPDFWGQNCQSLPTLKTFSICTSRDHAQEFSVSGFSKLAEIFPELVRFEVDHLDNFPAVAPCLWKFKKLEQLTISLFVGSNSNSNSNSNEEGAIDSALTGFTMETCQKLWKEEEFLEWAKKNAAKTKAKTKAETDQEGKAKEEKSWKNPDSGFSDSPESIKSLRVNPSICDLSKLKTFSVIFWDRDVSQNESYFLMSELSGLFAFDLMPQLEVQLIPRTENYGNLPRMRNHLEELEPYINYLGRSDCSGSETEESVDE